MAVYTILDRELVSRLVADYELGELVEIEPVASGIENTNYFVWTKKTDQARSAWVLTVFENLVEEQLPFFNRLTHYLFSLGFSVPAPLAMKDGADYFQLSEAELTCGGKKCGVIVPRFSGKAKERHSIQECQQIAQYMARMHLALQNFPAIRAVDHNFLWFESRVHQLGEHLMKRDSELLEHAWQRYQSYIDKLNACTSGIVHGDLFRDNVLFDAHGISGVIDFYHAGFSPLLFDLAVAANDWVVLANYDEVPNHSDAEQLSRKGLVYDESKLDAMFQAYISVRPLTQMETELWPRFLELAAFRFWLSRLKTLHLPGYQENIKQGHCLKSPDAMRLILEAAMQR